LERYISVFGISLANTIYGIEGQFAEMIKVAGT
jgi:hypothetical protein